MSIVLQDLKTLLEVDIEETIYDDQLLMYANAGLRYLENNGVPVEAIEKETDSANFKNLKPPDFALVLSYLHLYCLQRFDRTLMTGNGQSNMSWIDAEMLDLITMLKVRYDIPKQSEVVK